MTSTGATRGNPYVGPKTFTEAQRNLFFGREREAGELCARVLSERLVLFYAQSGAGKSSLIHARLIPRLRDDFGYAVLPVARVSGEPPGRAAEVDNIYLFNLMLRLDSSGRDPGRFAHTPLAQFLAGLYSDDGRRYVYEDAFEPVDDSAPAAPSALPCILIIDQFEELITGYPDQWTKREAFFRQLNQALVADPQLWVLLAFREDYLAPIEPFAPLLTDRMRARFYMERMGIEAGLEAVRRPAELGGRPFAPGAAERLLEDLRQVRVAGQAGTIAGPAVEPVQLQVVCYQLWKTIEHRPLGEITTEDLAEAGDVDRALIRFYEEVLAAVLASPEVEVTERQIRTWFEEKLITPDGTRGLVRQDRDATGELPNAAVRELQDRFLLRSDSRAGDTRIEIVHDRFVAPILDSNRVWRARHQDPLVLAAEAWLAAGKRPRDLLLGEQLRSAQTRLAVVRAEMTDTERRMVTALLEASEARERERRDLLSAQQVALLERQKYIAEMGWGVIFPAVEPTEVVRQQEQEAIREALGPLLEHRRAEAALRRPERYREFTGADGYRPGETAERFLARSRVGPGVVDPGAMPYYLLLVGDPETIPFEFQYLLDVRFAVGRIHFETIDDYRRYAETVVRAETGTSTRPRRVAVFAPKNPADRATRESCENLAQPLIETLAADRPDWNLMPILAEHATKARLGSALGGDETPALLFAASRGLDLPMDNPRQFQDRGALLCQDWPGTAAENGCIPAGFYFAADDIDPAADLLGLIAFVFAEHGAGTPRLEDFYHQAFKPPTVIAKQSFLARLPQRLLSHPGGGALAFIGHVEMVWNSSFIRSRTGDQTGVRTYAAVIERLMDGYPVGAALEPFNQRYAEFATLLSEARKRSDSGEETDPYEMADKWTKTIDARNWIVIGDPAVRLMVSDLRPDMACLKAMYQSENLRSEGDRLAAAGDLRGAEAKYRELLDLNPWLRIDPAAEAGAVAAQSVRRRGIAAAIGS